MKLFLYGWHLAEALESIEEGQNPKTHDLGRLSEIEKAKIIGYEFRKFMKNFHIVRGRKVIYGLLVDAEKAPDFHWRKIPVSGISESGKFTAPAFLPLFYLPLDMKVVAYMLKYSNLFFGGDEEFQEYMQMIGTAPPLGTETIPEESQYII